MKYLSTITFFLLSALSIMAQNVNPGDVINVQLKAYNNRDIDAFVATYSEHVQCFEYGQTDPFLEGKQALKVSYGAMFQTSPDLHAKSTNRIIQGNRVIDHEIADGINGRSAIQVVVIYEVNEGLIQKVTFIY